jgi:hypothetical protein
MVGTNLKIKSNIKKRKCTANSKKILHDQNTKSSFHSIFNLEKKNRGSSIAPKENDVSRESKEKKTCWHSINLEH